MCSTVFQDFFHSPKLQSIVGSSELLYPTIFYIVKIFLPGMYTFSDISFTIIISNAGDIFFYQSINHKWENNTTLQNFIAVCYYQTPNTEHIF